MQRLGYWVRDLKVTKCTLLWLDLRFSGWLSRSELGLAQYQWSENQAPYLRTPSYCVISNSNHGIALGTNPLLLRKIVFMSSIIYLLGGSRWSSIYILWSNRKDAPTMIGFPTYSIKPCLFESYNHKILTRSVARRCMRHRWHHVHYWSTTSPSLLTS
jgi:hypothetical protein